MFNVDICNANHVDDVPQTIFHPLRLNHVIPLYHENCPTDQLYINPEPRVVLTKLMSIFLSPVHHVATNANFGSRIVWYDVTHVFVVH